MSPGEVRGWIGTVLNFVPAVWLIYLAVKHRRPDVAYFWVAVAFALGGIFDLAAHYKLGWEIAGHVYPVGQSALIAAVLLDKHTALWIVVALGSIAIASLMLWPTDPDVALHGVAWLGIGWVANRLRPIGPLWLCLFWAFGLALPAYYWFLLSGRDLLPWLVMRGCYAVGLLYFCKAASLTRAPLRAL